MAPPAGALSSLLLLAVIAGGACMPCTDGRTYSNAVISPDLETTRITQVSQATTGVDCTRACCDLPSCDLAWWFQGRCYLVSCPHKDNCEPKMSHVKSHLTFVRRPAQRPAQLLDYGTLGRDSPADLWGDSPENIRRDLPFLGKDEGLEEMSEYSEDYQEQDLLQPISKQERRGGAKYTDWGSLPGSDGDIHSSAAEDVPLAEAKQQEDPEFQYLDREHHELNESVQTPASQASSDRRLLSPSVTPPTAEILETETLQLKEKSANGAGKGTLVPTSRVPSSSLESSTATVGTTAVLLVIPGSTEPSIPTPPTSSRPSEAPSPEEPTAPVTDPQTVKELFVSAGDNLIITLPENEVKLTAMAVPAPPTETAYNYEWSLISHPVDYQGGIKEAHMQTLSLSQLSVGLYVFKVVVSGDAVFGEGFVNVTVRPARRVNVPPRAVVSPQRQELTLPLTSALIDGSQSTDDIKIVRYHWEEINGPFKETTTSSESSVLRLFDLVPGNYTFRLTVTDSDGASDSTVALVRVNNAVDHPPVANAGPNRTITLPQNSITLNGNQSSDDHQIDLYAWSLGPGSERKEVAMQGADTPYLHLSAMQEGAYTFQLMVTDSSKQQSTSLVTVVVRPENNRPPVAVAGPDKELFFPSERITLDTTLDGSRSSDDHGIVFYHWEHVSGPSAVEMGNADTPIAIVTGLQVGTYHFRLTVRDEQGLSSTATVTVAVKKETNNPPRAQAGGRHVLVLPNNSITLDGSRSTDDHGIVSYLWNRDGRSPAAGDVLEDSDHSASLRLTNLVEGVYTFRLQVADGQGASDTDTATVEVQPDPRKNDLVELILQVSAGQLSEQQKDTLIRQLALLLNVLDSDIKVQKIQAHSDLSTVIVFYVQSGPPLRILKAAEVARHLHSRLSKERADFLLFKVLRIDTAGCLLTCSGHGHCDPITKRCICSQLWMENPVLHYLQDGASNCEWSVFYVTVLAFIFIALTGGLTWLCVYCCKRQKRTKIRKKTKYTILDDMDDQERMELRPQYGIKHRSTEHNSSLMVSESEFDSDQDTIFSRERMDRRNSRVSLNGSIRNGTLFNYCLKDR